jgi:plasmid stabilization system protein ParE
VKRPVFWSRDALDEVKRAAARSAKDNPQAAHKVAAAIRSAGNKLGERATGRKGRMIGTYEKSVTGVPYIVACALHPVCGSDESVVILHVIHTARNWTPDAWPDV